MEYSEIFKAYRHCRRRKRSTNGFLNFEQNFVENFISLTDSINNGTYEIGSSYCFVVDYPKPREVFAADFKDRIIHHEIFDTLNPYYEKKFIFDSYACRKDKGNLKAVERLNYFMLSLTNNGKERAYFLQCDIKGFFISIDKNILWNILSRDFNKSLANLDEIKKEEMIHLIQTTLFHDPIDNYVNKSSKSKWKLVDREKSLFYADDFKGLPIGNLTSQFFANMYLNELDYFIKHTLHIKHYVRYMDDFIILSKDRKQLKVFRKKIDEFLKSSLKLKLKKKSKLSSLSSGINFVGYIQHLFYRLPRRRVVNNLLDKLSYFRKNLNILKLRETLNSYIAYFKNCNGFRIFRDVLNDNLWLNDLFVFGKRKIRFQLRNI
jgi:hypothetical protein